MIVQISAGQGSFECQLAFGKLFEALQKEYGDLLWLSDTRGCEKGCFHWEAFQSSKRTGREAD